MIITVDAIIIGGNEKKIFFVQFDKRFNVVMNDS